MHGQSKGFPIFTGVCIFIIGQREEGIAGRGMTWKEELCSKGEKRDKTTPHMEEQGDGKSLILFPWKLLD